MCVYLRYLSKALLELGHTVDVISGEPYPHLEEGVRLIKLPGLNLYENGLSSLRLHHFSSWANIVEWCSKLTGGFAEPYCFGRRANAYLKKHGKHYDIIHDNQSLSRTISLLSIDLDYLSPLSYLSESIVDPNQHQVHVYPHHQMLMSSKNGSIMNVNEYSINQMKESVSYGF